MGKKRAREADGKATAARDDDRMEDSDEEEEDFDVVDVEFEWFNFDPEVDFHGTKTLLRQLLDVDATLHDVSGLADVVLGQPTIGSTVKVDGKANDAYALLTALSLRELRDKPAVAQLTAYLKEKAAAADAPELATTLVPLLEHQQASEPPADGPHVGLVLAERLINMPAEVGPPMFAMLLDELEAAVEDGEPYAFTHYLVLSKTYQEVASDLGGMVVEEEGGEAKGKRKKARTSGSASALGGGPFYFHVEDEVLRKHALASGTYAFTKTDEAVADSRRAFQELGIESRGLLVLIEAAKFPAAVQAIGEYLKP